MKWFCKSISHFPYSTVDILKTIYSMSYTKCKIFSLSIYNYTILCKLHYLITSFSIFSHLCTYDKLCVTNRLKIHNRHCITCKTTTGIKPLENTKLNSQLFSVFNFCNLLKNQMQPFTFN